MNARRCVVLVSIIAMFAACSKGGETAAPVAKASGNAVFVDTVGLSPYKDVSGAVLTELGKNKDIRLVTDRRDANIYLGVNAITPDDINEMTKNNLIVLSYVLVNFDNKNATNGLGIGQRNLLEPFVSNVSTVVSSFVKHPADAGKKQ